MPRGRSGGQSYSGPSDDELSEFSALLGGQLEARAHFPLADGILGKLIERVLDKGYAMRLAPVDGGRGRAVVVYLSDDRRPEARGSDPEELEELLKRLYMAAEKLPHKRT